MSALYQSLFLKTLEKIQEGRLVLHLPAGQSHMFGSPGDEPPVEMRVVNPDCFRTIILHQDIGLGESFMLGHWTTNDLSAFLKLLIRNREFLAPKRFGGLLQATRTLAATGDRIRHRMRSNTRRKSRENIHAHYDLGNSFYSEFLDTGMTYSSAFFTHNSQDMGEAQSEKYDRICRKLNLHPGVHLLEIGSGWGGFAIHAATHYGCRVTTGTISEQQYAWAKSRIEAAGLADRIELRFQDYREIQGKFDRIASIEMLEAVGHEHLNSYFKQCAKLLKSDGILAIQVILSPDSRYAFYRKRVDFIRKHIFPGGHLPSFQSIHDSVHKHTTWDLYHHETFGMHYAETLRRWKARFLATADTRRRLDFDETFDRKWEFYFSYCEAGFDMRHIQVAQLSYAAPNNPHYQYETLQREAPWHEALTAELAEFR